MSERMEGYTNDVTSHYFLPTVKVVFSRESNCDQVQFDSGQFAPN